MSIGESYLRITLYSFIVIGCRKVWKKISASLTNLHTIFRSIEKFRKISITTRENSFGRDLEIKFLPKRFKVNLIILKSLILRSLSSALIRRLGITGWHTLATSNRLKFVVRVEHREKFKHPCMAQCFGRNTVWFSTSLAFGRVEMSFFLFFFHESKNGRELARGKEERKLRHEVHSHDLKLPREQLFPFRAVSLSNIFFFWAFFPFPHLVFLLIRFRNWWNLLFCTILN